MSDTSQGPGWWLATEGKWYPPSSPPPPPAPPGPTLAPPTGPIGSSPGGPPTGPALPTYPPARPTSGRAITVLVLGIVSLVTTCGSGLGLVPAIVALALAPGARREIAESGGRLDGASQIRAGVICSWVTVGLVGLGILFFLGFLLLSALTGGFGSSEY